MIRAGQESPPWTRNEKQRSTREGYQKTKNSVDAQMNLEYVQRSDGKFRDWLGRYREEIDGEPPPRERLDH